MKKHKQRDGHRRPILLTFLGLIALSLVIAVLLKGTDITLFNPKGEIAQEEFKLLLFTAAILFGIAVPTLAVLYFYAWKYRETSPNLEHDPDTRHGKLFVFTIWAIPCAIMVVLSLVMWSATHRLEPQKAIAADTAPLRIQVVAMRWKWLFIYPEQRIASVNFLQIPTGTPVQFDLTADDAPMSSFWIPHLSGQLYAMTGHVNRLNIIAQTPGDYPGRSAEINGSGFAGMRFVARASSTESFNEWVQFLGQSTSKLDAAAYKELVKPSENHPIAYYADADADIYASVIEKYMDSHSHKAGHQ